MSIIINQHEKQSEQSISIHSKQCSACWKCIEACNRHVLGKVKILWHKHARVVNAQACIACKKCIAVCENGALSISK